MIDYMSENTHYKNYSARSRNVWEDVVKFEKSIFSDIFAGKTPKILWKKQHLTNCNPMADTIMEQYMNAAKKRRFMF